MQQHHSNTPSNITGNSNSNSRPKGDNAPPHSALAVARRHEVDALRYVAAFGHLRAPELAPMLWPHAASTASACVMARRTLLRLVEKRLLIERMNALGTKSYVLTPRGADVAESYWGRGLGMWDDKPRGAAILDGYDVAVAGPLFQHRTIGTAYVALCHISQGHAGWGEFAIEKRWAPATRDELKKQWHKLPDALAFVPDRALTTRIIDWIEVESAWKPSHELKKVLGIAWRLNRPIAKDAYVRVGRLVIVYDVAERHEQRIIRTVLEVAREQATEDGKTQPRARLPDDAPYSRLIDLYEKQFGEVDLVRMKILAPLRIVDMQTVTLLSVLREKYPGASK